jgi:hypothetical protein
MGMYVSQLRSVPVGAFRYYLYLVDAAHGAHSETIDRFFNGIATSGVDAVIVRGPQNLSHELYTFFQSHAREDFDRLEILFREATCIIVGEGALQTTDKPIHILPLLYCDERAQDQLPTLTALMDALIQAMANGKLADFVRSLGAEEIKLGEVKRGMLIATLRRMNEALELKPNLAGLGVNLNAVIDRFLGHPERSLDQETSRVTIRSG